MYDDDMGVIGISIIIRWLQNLFHPPDRPTGIRQLLLLLSLRRAAKVVYFEEWLKKKTSYWLLNLNKNAA